VALVRERNIPTGRPPLVGEVNAKFFGYRLSRGQRDGFLWPYSRLSRLEPLLFLPSSSSIVLRGWVNPVQDSQLLRKSGSEENRILDLWICSQSSDHYTTEAVIILNLVFWILTSRILVDGYKSFGENYCLHLQCIILKRFPQSHHISVM
jgi:hypothetical protein